MPSLAQASDEQISAIYRESFPLWGAGLQPADYRELWDELAATAWVRRHARFLVWLDSGGSLLSSLKRYRPLFRLGERRWRVSVLGAIFTPRERRRRGHAADLIRTVLDQARRDGDPYALLFSDIGLDYYRSLGFEAIPASEQWGVLPRRLEQVAPSWSLRPYRPEDDAEIEAAHQAMLERRPVALERDPEHWSFLRLRAGAYFRRLNDPTIRVRHDVALCDGRFAGYLSTVEGRGEWNIREIVAADGDPQAMARILDLGAARGRADGARRFYGWLPPELISKLHAGWNLRQGRRQRARPMCLRLSDDPTVPSPSKLPPLFVPYQDQF